MSLIASASQPKSNLAETADAVAEVLSALADADTENIPEHFQWWADLVNGSEEDDDEDEDEEEDDDDIFAQEILMKEPVVDSTTIATKSPDSNHNDAPSTSEGITSEQSEAKDSAKLNSDKLQNTVKIQIQSCYSHTEPNGPETANKSIAVLNDGSSSSTNNEKHVCPDGETDVYIEIESSKHRQHRRDHAMWKDHSNALQSNAHQSSIQTAPIPETETNSSKGILKNTPAEETSTEALPTTTSNFSRWRRRALSRRAKDFQSSLRMSIRKRSQRKKNSQQTNVDMDEPVTYIDGIADVLTVLAEQTKTSLFEELPDSNPKILSEQTPGLSQENCLSSLSNKDDQDDKRPFARAVRESLRRKKQSQPYSFNRFSARRDSKSPVMRRRADAVEKRLQRSSQVISFHSEQTSPLKPPTTDHSPQTVLTESEEGAFSNTNKDSSCSGRSRSSAVVSIRRKEELSVDEINGQTSVTMRAKTPHESALSLKRAMRGLSRSRLNASVRRGDITPKSAKLSIEFVVGELKKLVDSIKRFGRRAGESEEYNVIFGILYEKTDGIFEASDLDNILITARSLGIVSYTGAALFPGRDDLVMITLVSDKIPEDESAYTLGQIRSISTRRKRHASTIESAIPPNEERLGASVRRGQLSAKSATAAVQWADKQLQLLIDVIAKYGLQDNEGKFKINFGILYDKTVNILEAAEIGALLDTARNRGLVSYVGEELKVFDDDLVTVTLLNTNIAESNTDSYTFNEIRRISLRQRRSTRRSQRAHH